MIIERNVSPAVWIDLSTPTKNEAKTLLEQKKIPIDLLDELIHPTERPVAIMADGVLFAVFHFPKSHKESDETVEVDFVVGGDFVLTSHYEPVLALEHFSKMVEVEEITERAQITAADGPLLFSAILTRLYEHIYDELEVVESSVRQAEERIFSGHEKEMVFALSKISRTILNFKKTMDPHERNIHQIAELIEKHFGETYKASILGSFEKAKNTLKSENEFVKELQETNLALLETKQNEIMKTLTILASLILPMSFIAALFTVPAKFTPILGEKNDFWLIGGIMIIVALCFFVFMKRKKWI